MVVTTDINQGYKPTQFEVSRGSIKPLKEPLPQSTVTTSATTDSQMQSLPVKKSETSTVSSAQPAEVVTQPEAAAQSNDSSSSPDTVFSQVDEAVFSVNSYDLDPMLGRLRRRIFVWIERRRSQTILI